MLGLVDGNNFFVSCERVFDPALENRPVAVLSNNDGCIISRSNECKALGLPMGTPYFQLQPHLAEYGLILRSSNYELYADMSRRLIAALCRLVPEVDQYSIDEAFIYPGLPEDADHAALGRRIRQTVLKLVGIPCGIGFAPTRTLAKIANHLGKKRPDGVFVMSKDCQTILDGVPVDEVWGIGRRLAPKLHRLGIHNAGQLAQRDPLAMQKRFSVQLARTIWELRGVPGWVEDAPEEPPQSITCSRSFGHPVLTLADLSEAVASYAAQAAAKLRSEHQLAAGMTVYFQLYPEYQPVKLDAKITSTSVKFAAPTDDNARMMAAVRSRLESIFLPARRYKKAGVLLWGLEKPADRTADLFAPGTGASALFRAVDEINAKYGRNTIFTLGEGIAKPWQMRRDQLSPAYTTNWRELLKVK